MTELLLVHLLREAVVSFSLLGMLLLLKIFKLKLGVFLGLRDFVKVLLQKVLPVFTINFL